MSRRATIGRSTADAMRRLRPVTIHAPFPELIDFLAGYPGPAEAPFRGGSIKVISALIYRDGMRIQWRMSQEPDLSWIELDAPKASARLPKGPQRPGFIEAHAKGERMKSLWEHSTLVDDRGGKFKLSLQRQSFGRGLWEGDAWCARPASPLDARKLTLRIGDAEVVIPCNKDPRGRTHLPHEFLVGYSGPKRPESFHGGAIKVISVLVYVDSLTIEWLMRPVPDLSWLPTIKDSFDRTLSKLRDRDESDLLGMVPATPDPFLVWSRARLADDRGTNYLGELSGGGSFPGGYKGEIKFSPSVPATARELHLTLYDLAVFIPLRVPPLSRI